MTTTTGAESSTAEDDDSNILLDVFWLALLPATCMLLCTIVGILWVRVPFHVAGALQHFAAGILLSTIGTELLPTLIAASGIWPNVGVTVGFFGGMATLILLGILLPEEEEEESTEITEEDAIPNQQSVLTNIAVQERQRPKPKKQRRPTGAEGVLSGVSLRRKSQSLRSSGYNLQKKYWDDFLDMQEKESERSEDQLCNTETQALLTAGNTRASRVAQAANRQSSSFGSFLSSQNVPLKNFPTAFLAAVLVDSALDGILIGIARNAPGKTAGPMMALSLSVEMSFIGLTLATALQPRMNVKSLLATLAGPLVLIGGALLGGLLANLLSENPSMFAGMMGFGTSALLFMVAEELLLESHAQDDFNHLWWIDVQLYTGFYVSFMTTKLIPE